MSNVFSDEQIVQAISICLQHHKDCNECPLVDVDNCTILRNYALDLINRLKKEIERLHNIKIDLEHQLTQKGLTEYVGADVIEAETRKKTARKIIHYIDTEIRNYINDSDLQLFNGDIKWLKEQCGVEAQDNV